ncbi:hypothetical protein CLAIMM_05053 [Cladophialophora immunda]|nr:hypothetical protein CLAIMM_05053 [Cladophialophora immunda]
MASIPNTNAASPETCQTGLIRPVCNYNVPVLDQNLSSCSPSRYCSKYFAACCPTCQLRDAEPQSSVVPNTAMYDEGGVVHKGLFGPCEALKTIVPDRALRLWVLALNHFFFSKRPSFIYLGERICFRHGFRTLGHLHANGWSLKPQVNFQDA